MKSYGKWVALALCILVAIKISQFFLAVKKVEKFCGNAFVGQSKESVYMKAGEDGLIIGKYFIYSSDSYGRAICQVEFEGMHLKSRSYHFND